MLERILQILEEVLNYRTVGGRQATYWAAVVIGVILGGLVAPGGFGGFLSGLFQISPAAQGLHGLAEWWVTLGVLTSIFDAMFGKRVKLFLGAPVVVILGPILVEFAGLDLLGTQVGTVSGFLQWFVFLGLITVIIGYPAAKSLRMPMARGFSQRNIAGLIIGLAVVSLILEFVVDQALYSLLTGAGVGISGMGLSLGIAVVAILVISLFYAHERVPGI